MKLLEAMKLKSYIKFNNKYNKKKTLSVFK